MKKAISSLLLILVVFPMNAFAADLPDGLEIGAAAPTFFLMDLDRQSFFLSRALKEGKPILLSFYATWCVPCRKEIPAYEAMLQDDAFADVRILYIHVGEPTAKPGSGDGDADMSLIDKMKSDLGMTHLILYDRYHVAFKKYGGKGLPTTAVIAPDGTLAYYHSGYEPGDEEKVRRILLDLMP